MKFSLQNKIFMISFHCTIRNITGGDQLLKVDSEILIDKDVLKSHFPEIFIVNVPDIANIKATILPLHQEEEYDCEVANTIFTVRLNGRVRNEVFRRDYNVDMKMQTTLRSDTDDETPRPEEQYVAYNEDTFSHRAFLLRSNELLDATQRLTLNYTIVLNKVHSCNI